MKTATLGLALLALVSASWAQTKDVKSDRLGMGSTEAPQRGGENGSTRPPQIQMDARREGIDMANLKDMDLGAAVRGMSENDRDELCKRAIRGGADDDMLTRLKAVGADCMAAMKRDREFVAKGGQAETAMTQMKRTKPTDQWEDSEWEAALRKMPTAIGAEDIKDMKPDVMRRMMDNGDLRKAAAKMKGQAEKRALEAKLKGAYGEPESWDKAAIEKMGDMMGSMSLDTLEKIPKDKMKEAMITLSDVMFDDAGKRSAAGRVLVEGMGKGRIAQWTADEVKYADQFIRKNAGIVSQLPESAIEQSMRDLGSKPTDMAGAAPLGKRIKKMADFQDPSRVDSAKVEKLGHLMKGMGGNYLRRLRKDAVQGALTTLRNVSFPRGEAKELVDKIKGNLRDYTVDKLCGLGNLVTGLDEEDLEQIPADVIEGAIDDLANKDFEVSQCRVLVRKAKGKKNLMKKMGKLMKKCMTVEDLKDASIDDLGLDCSTDTPPAFTPDAPQAAAMFKKVKERFGKPSKSNTNYTLSCMTNLGCVAALGMEPSDFENLPDNGDMKSVMEKLAECEPEMDDAQTQAISMRLKEFLNLDNPQQAAAIDEATIERVGVFMKHFNDADLEKIDRNMRPTLARKIGNATTERMPESELMRLKNFALKHVRRDDTGEVVDRRNSRTLDDNDVRDLGDAFGGMEENDVRKMDKTAMKNNMASVADKVRDRGVQKALVENAQAKDPSFFQMSENIVSIAAVSGGLEQRLLDTIDELVLGEVMTDVADMLDKKMDRDQRRDKAGFSGEIDNADRQTMAMQKKAMLRKSFRGYIKSQSSGASLTCQDVQALRSSVDILTTEQIESLSDTDFSDCAETFGANSKWSREQLGKLASKAKKSLGNPSDWSSTDIRRVGSIAAGLSEREIEQLEINSTALLSKMGESASFSPEQLKAGFRTMLRKAHGGNIKNLTGDDLMAVGKFACGAEASDIDQIDVESFRSAVASVGKLSCDASQMSSFAKKAKIAFGEPSRWGKSTLSSLGEVVSGLGESDVRSLPAQLLGGIGPNVLAKIDPAAMAGLSREQLGSLSISQISAMSDRQKSALPSKMRDLVLEKLPKVGMKTVGDKKVMPGGIELDTRRAGMDISQLKRLDASSLGDAVRQMSESDRDTLCQSAIRGGADTDMLKTLKTQGADCVQAIKRDTTFKPTGGEAESVMKQMRDEKPTNKWVESDWTFALRQMSGAIKADDLRTIDASTMRTLVTNGDMREAAGSMKTQSEKRAMEGKLKEAFGQPDAWDKSALESMGSLLGSMEPETLRRIPKEHMRAAAAIFKDIPYDNPSAKAAAGRQLVKSLGNDASSWSAEDVKNADKYIRGNPKVIKDLSDSALLSAMDDLGARDSDQRGTAELGRRVKEMKEFSDAAALDSTKVAKMGHLMQAMGKEYLKKLSVDAISGALTTLANVSFPRGDARELITKIKGTVTSYTGDKVREFGKLIVGLEPEDFDQMPDSAIGDAIANIAEMDFDISQCRAIVKKVRSSGKANLKKMGKLMSKCISPEELKDATLEELGLTCDTDTAPTMKPDKAQSKEMFKKIRAHFGSPARDNANYTLSCMTNLGCVAALGMEPSDFENLPDNGDMKSVMEKLAECEPEMDDGQTRAISKRLREFLDMDNQTAVEGHDSAVIEQVGFFLKHFNDTDLERFNKSVRADVARKVGEANQDNQPKGEMMRLKRFALKHVKRDSNSEVTDRRNAEFLDDNDIRALRNLFGGLEETDALKINKTAMENNVVAMNDKVRDIKVQRALWTNAQDKDPAVLDSSENIIAAAGLVGGIPDDMLSSMNKSIMAEALSDAASMMETRKAKDKRREDMGFKSEVSDSDRQSMENQKSEFVKKAFQGYIESRSGTTTANRRKRATVAVTCSDVQVLGSNAVSLTTTQIDSLSNTDFTDCTETLGAITGWSTEQLSSLVSKAKTVYGTPSTWSSANVKLVGTMCAGLTSSEISTLALSSAPVLATMGTSTAFSSTQLKAGFAQFLSTARSNAVSGVTGDDLMTIGNFACGAETSHIQLISQTAFTTAVTSIGKLTTCDASQLAAYAVLAKTAYSASSTWDSTTMISVGSIIGGLTDAEISALTSTQIGSIAAVSMAHIPATTFASFSESQLSSFSASQANSVTASQQSALSTSQRSALIAAGASDLTTSSGSAGVQLSLLSLVATIFVFFL